MSSIRELVVSIVCDDMFGISHVSFPIVEHGPDLWLWSECSCIVSWLRLLLASSYLTNVHHLQAYIPSTQAVSCYFLYNSIIIADLFLFLYPSKTLFFLLGFHSSVVVSYSYSPYYLQKETEIGLHEYRGWLCHCC